MEPTRYRVITRLAGTALVAALGWVLPAGEARAAETEAPATIELPPTPGSARETTDKTSPWGPGKRGKWGGWWDHYRDSNDQEYNDFSVFMSYKQVYGQVWTGDYTDGIELGGYLRDKRRSTYGGYYRFRDDFDHIVQLETAQVLPKGFVATGSVRFIRVIPDDVEDDRSQVQYGAGFDWYHGDYDFLTFRAISDPRESGRWTFLLSHRFYLREWMYLEPAILSRTDGSTNWFLRGKVKYFVWLFGDFNQYDFSDVDRKQFSLGVEFPW